jgi:hypothetical protein
MKINFLFTLFTGLLSLINSESTLELDIIESYNNNSQKLEYNQRQDIYSLIINLETSGTIWLNYYIYSTDDCSNTIGLVGGLSSDRCEQFSGGSRSMSSCDDTDGINVMITYDLFTTTDCSGLASNTETSLYPAICKNDSPNQGGYRGFCTTTPDYGIQGTKEYQTTTCDGLVTSYLGYTEEACVTNGDGTYTEIIYKDCSLATISYHNNADCSDSAINYMNYPIILDGCHNDVNTDDLIYFDDDINNGNHWYDKGSIMGYCNSGETKLTNFKIGLFVSITLLNLLLL